MARGRDGGARGVLGAEDRARDARPRPGVSAPERPRAVALIPARAGSTRLPGKNVRTLKGHPLIAYTIAAARAAGVYDAVVVSTEAPEIARIAVHYGAEAPSLRPAAMAASTSTGTEWVVHVL